MAGETEAANEPEKRSGRSRSASCVFAALVIIAIIAGLFTWAYLTTLRSATDNSALFSSMGLTESDVERWLDEPLSIPTNWWDVPSEHSSKFHQLEYNIQFTEEMEEVSPLFDTRFPEDVVFSADGEPLPPEQSTYEKLLACKELNTQDWDRLASFTQVMPEWLESYNNLLDDEEYAFNFRRMAGINYPFLYEWNNKISREHSGWAIVLAMEGKTASAVRALQDITRIVRTDNGYVIPALGNRTFCRTLNAVSSYTSDTKQLRTMVSLMNENRAVLLNIQNDASVVAGDVLRLASAMKKSGFIKSYPTTRRELINLVLPVNTARFRDYLHARNPNDPLLEDLDGFPPDGNFSNWRLIRERIRFAYQHKLVFQMIKGMFVELVPPLRHDISCLSMQRSSCMRAYNTLEELREETLRFDFLRIKLARRIATLEGKPDLTKPEMFVPEFFEKLPVDPYAKDDAPLQFDDVKDEFFSVGKDSEPGTTDDVYESHPDLDQAPEFQSII